MVVVGGGRFGGKAWLVRKGEERRIKTRHVTGMGTRRCCCTCVAGGRAGGCTARIVRRRDAELGMLSREWSFGSFAPKG